MSETIVDIIICWFCEHHKQYTCPFYRFSEQEMIDRLEQSDISLDCFSRSSNLLSVRSSG